MKIYCSGIGGIGLSAYASLQRADGHTVFGSDRVESTLLDDLRSQGIVVTLDQNGQSIPLDSDLFVYSEAIPADAPERRRAAELGLLQHSYPEAVATLTEGKRLIAVCGTHGKSSTTAMVARLLMDVGMDPTVVIGTKMQELNGKNWRKGGGPIFVLEACEYRRSFLHYNPSIILLTNCDGDHFDYYRNAEEYRNAFVEFIQRLPSDGTLITHVSDLDCRAVAQASGRLASDADRFPLITLNTPGVHMQQNATLVLALASILDIPQQKAISILSGYSGSWRRMERVGHTIHNIPVIDDYGHHPQEIRATLNALRRQSPERRLICVFQPHTHNRTLKLYEDFTHAFTDADVVIIPNVYDARSETETGQVDVPTFVHDIARQSSVHAIEGHSLDETNRLLTKKILKPNDLLLCMGAGDVTNLALSLLAAAR